MSRLLLILALIAAELTADPHVGVDRYGVAPSAPTRGLAAATGQDRIAGQIYTVARGEARKEALDASLRTSLGKGLSFGLLGRLAEDQIGTVAIGQGSSLYASSFPLPQQLPDYVERGTLRDRHSRDLWIMIEFKDESRANFFSDLDPHVIDELYAEAEGKTSRVNGFRASKLRSHGKLFEALGARRVTPSRAKGYPSGQIVFAEFSLD